MFVVFLVASKGLLILLLLHSRLDLLVVGHDPNSRPSCLTKSEHSIGLIRDMLDGASFI